MPGRGGSTSGARPEVLQNLIVLRAVLDLALSKLMCALLTCTFFNPGQGFLSALTPAREDLQGEHSSVPDATACAGPVDPSMQT